MIEVEIRGELTKEEFDKANSSFALSGILKEVQDREMVVLFDLPGFDIDPTKRKVDVRIRTTNGMTEIMVKKMASENNVARFEKSYDLGEISLQEGKEFVKIFGSTKGNWMHRKKSVYDYDGVEWSLVEAVPGIYYFEAEMLADENEDLEKIRLVLVKKAENLGYKVFSTDEFRDYIKMLNEKVNKRIEW